MYDQLMTFSSSLLFHSHPPYYSILILLIIPFPFSLFPSGAPIPEHPSVRLHVTTGSITAVSVSLVWDAVTPITGYMLQYRPVAQPSWSDARSLSTSTTMQSPQGLESSTAYLARVIILNNCSQQVTPEVTFTTLGECGRGTGGGVWA